MAMTNRKSIQLWAVKLQYLAIALFLIIGLIATKLLAPRIEQQDALSIVSAEVSKLVGKATKDRINEAQAFSELVALDEDAIPFIVSHLGNMDALPDQQISIPNRWPGAVETNALYGAEVVHDALSAILRHKTNQDIGAFELGNTPEERNARRQSSRAEWVRWCRKKYPARANDCGIAVDGNGNATVHREQKRVSG